MTNYSNNCVRYLLLIFATFFVYGNAGATDVSFDVKEGNASQYSSYLGQTVNVTLQNRTFTAYEWTGVCFPFSATKEQLDATFGEGKYTIEQFSSFSESTISFKIMEEPAVVAGTPYIIRVTETKENPVFSGVTFASTLDNDNTNFGSQNDNCHIDIAEDLTFRGYYFKKDGAYRLVGGQNAPTTAYWINTNGKLRNYLVWSSDVTLPDTYYGSGAYFSSQTLGETILTLQLEQPASGGGSGSGEGGGGDDPIDQTTMAYKIANKLQLTDVPTIYLTIPDVNDIDNDLKKDKSGTTWVADYHRATILVVDNSQEGTPQHLDSFTDAGLQIKVRGNSTSDPKKRPYRLKFDKDEKDPVTGEKIATHKHDLLGYGYKKRNWTLLANTFDATMIRNAVTYHLNKAIGMDFCPGYKFVDLVINGDYRGTYQVSDQVEAGSNRVDVDEDTGWMFEFARQDMTEDPKFTTPIAGSIKNPDYDDLTETEQAALTAEIQPWLIDWAAKFSNNTFTSSTTGWRSINDEESLINFYIGINITGDYDGFMTVKCYKGADGKMHFGPIWDKDLAFGNYSADDGTTLVEDQQNGNFKYYIKGDGNCLMKDPKFVANVKARLDELIKGGLVTSLCTKVDELTALTEQTRNLNYSRWDITGDNALNNVGKYHEWSLDDFSKYTDQLKTYITDHIAWFKQQVDAQYETLIASAGSLTYDPTSQGDWDTGHTYTSLYSYNNKNYNLTVTPIDAISGDYWKTIYLPFDYTQTELEKLIGEYNLREFTGMKGSIFQFTKPVSKDINSCVPYLIKLKNSSATSATALNFGKVFISFDSEAIKSFTYGDYSVAAGLHATGLNTDGTNYVLNSEGELVQLPAGQYIEGVHNRANVFNGLQAYFVVPNDVTPSIYIEPDEPAVRAQLTNLPTIYIDTKDNAAINPSSGDWTQAGIQVIDGSNTLKPFVYAADAVTAKGKPVFQIRGRGAASWTNAAKKSYRIQFGKDDKDADGNVTTSYKHYLLGDEDAAGVVKKRNWVLLANAGDKTLVRNALTKEIGDIVELPFTPGYQFVDLVLNGTYVGTYQVTEFIEADANRVNIDEDNGLLIQMTGQADTSTGDHIIAGTDYTKPYLTIKNPEIKTANQETWNAAFNTDIYDFDGMWNATNGTGLDKSTLVNWYIASEITGNYEALSSIYAYLDATTKNLCFGPLWNNETAFDNHASINMTSEGLMNDADDATHNGLLTQAGKDAAWKTKLEDLWTRKWFAAAVYDRWKVLYNNGSLTTTLKGKVDNLAAIVNNTKSSQALNFSPAANGGAGWTITGQGITGYSKDVTNSAYADEVLRLKTYLEQRLPYLDKKFKILGEVDGPEITIGTGGYSSFSWPAALDFSATSVEVYVATSYENGILQLEKVADGKVPAETGIILKGSTGDSIYPESAENVSLTTTNILQNTASAAFTVSAENSYYALATLNGKTALYKIQSGVTIPQYKAYLSVMSQQAPAAIFFGDIDGTTTGLGMVSTLADGQDGDVYDLQGRRMKGNLAKGIYIKNGKKFIVK